MLTSKLIQFINGIKELSDSFKVDYPYCSIEAIGEFEGKLLVHFHVKSDYFTFLVLEDGSWSSTSDLSEEHELLFGGAYALWGLGGFGF